VSWLRSEEEIVINQGNISVRKRQAHKWAISPCVKESRRREEETNHKVEIMDEDYI